MSKRNDLRKGKKEAPSPRTEPTKIEVEFILERCGAEQVYICGDFNNWHPSSLRMVGTPEAGLWEKRLTLQPGRYEYKYLVDGNWTHDPDASENVPNVYGSLNSIVDVSGNRP